MARLLRRVSVMSTREREQEPQSLLSTHTAMGREMAPTTSYRQRVIGEAALALPPTVTVLLALFSTSIMTRHPILFASLASSAFLVYRDPNHQMNRVRVMVVAHLIGWSLGVGSALVFGSGYVAGAVAMSGTIVLLVLLNIVHPPAISTSLGFALFMPKPSALSAFLLALAMVAILAVLQRTAVWTLAWIARRGWEAPGRIMG